MRRVQHGLVVPGSRHGVFHIWRFPKNWVPHLSSIYRWIFREKNHHPANLGYFYIWKPHVWAVVIHLTMGILLVSYNEYIIPYNSWGPQVRDVNVGLDSPHENDSYLRIINHSDIGVRNAPTERYLSEKRGPHELYEWIDDPNLGWLHDIYMISKGL